MAEIYQDADFSTMESLIQKTMNHINANIDKFSDCGLERSSRIPNVLNLSKSKQKIILNCANKIDRMVGPDYFKIDIITSLMNIMLQKQNRVDCLTQKQLINFSLFLSSHPLENYPREVSLLGSRDIFDPIFNLTKDYFKQRSILYYIAECSQSINNWQEECEQIRFQKETKKMLESSDLDTLLAKTNYEKDLNEIFEIGSQLL